jgi:hypothetical protein
VTRTFGRAAPYALVSLLAWSSSAAAGTPETLRNIAFHPSDPNTYAAVFNEAGGGLLITHDDGRSFQLACMSYVMGEYTMDALLPVVSYTADGHLVVATFYGLFRDDGHGCGFARAAEFGDSYVAGLTVDPMRPGTLYALTSSGGQQNGIYRSLDQGATWSLFGNAENAFFRRLDIVPLASGGRRFYVSLARVKEGSFAVIPIVRVSDDEGTTFTDHEFPEDIDMTLAGVDALNPELIYALAPEAGGMGTKVLMNDAHGQPEAWRELGTVSIPGTLEIAPEGGFFLVDLGTRKLFRWTPADTVLTLVDASEVTCFERSPLSGRGFSCATWRLLGADASGMHSDELIYDMNQLDSLVACGAQGSDLIASCVPQLDYGWCGYTHYPDAPLCKALRDEPAAGCAPDAGVMCGDGGPVAGEPPKAKASDCSLASRRSVSGEPGLTALGLCALWLGRRVRRRSSLARR